MTHLFRFLLGTLLATHSVHAAMIIKQITNDSEYPALICTGLTTTNSAPHSTTHLADGIIVTVYTHVRLNNSIQDAYEWKYQLTKSFLASAKKNPDDLRVTLTILKDGTVKILPLFVL